MLIKILKNRDTVLRVAQAHLFKKKFPLSITFLITYRCNFSCHYCNIWNNSGYEMTTKEIISMIDTFSKMGLRRFSFNGGEPLLRPDIEELTAFCRKKNIFTTLFTNGWLVSKNIKTIKNLDILILSFDGPEKIHDMQRNRPGSYRHVIEAIKIARENNVPAWTNTVITKHNVKEIDFVLQKAREFGFFTMFQPVFEYSHSSDKREIDDLKFDMKGYQDAIRLLIKRKKEKASIVHSYSYLKYLMIPDWSKNKRTCWAGKLYCAIKPNGEVVPCYPVFNQKKWPNGLEIGFDEAFHRAQIASCKGCYCVIVESDCFYSLYPDAIVNTLRKLPLH